MHLTKSSELHSGPDRPVEEKKKKNLATEVSREQVPGKLLENGMETEIEHNR